MTSVGDQRQGTATGSHASRFNFPHCPHCHEQVIPDTKRCPACGGTLDWFSKDGISYDPSLDPLNGSRWQNMSLGRDHQGRLTGKAIAGLFLAFQLSWWMTYLNTSAPTDTMAFMISAMGLFAAYDVWAFTHGKTTSITRYGRHEATPSNTVIRVVGLLLDLALMAACIWYLSSRH